MLDWNTPLEDVYKDFPMLEELSRDELQSLKNDCIDSGAEEDKPIIRAIEIIQKGGDDDIPARS